MTHCCCLCLYLKIIHRDLKSLNIFLDTDFTAKVGDFGVSRELGTHTMTSIGTAAWMAPETLREERYSEKADVWAFGVITWEMVTREVPFDGVSPLAIVSMVAHQGRRLPLPSYIPAKIRDLLSSCFQDNAEARPTMAEILATLTGLDPIALDEEYARLASSWRPS